VRWFEDLKMRLVLTVVAGLLLSVGVARAEKVVPSGKPLILSQVAAVNPDCTSTGDMVMRVAQGPEHGRVSIRHTGIFPNFPASNVRSACNRRRVRGVQAIYVSQRGYLGWDTVVLESFGPLGRGWRTTIQIHVM
jgi:hypothetical protein